MQEAGVGQFGRKRDSERGEDHGETVNDAKVHVDTMHILDHRSAQGGTRSQRREGGEGNGRKGLEIAEIWGAERERGEGRARDLVEFPLRPELT